MKMSGHRDRLAFLVITCAALAATLAVPAVASASPSADTVNITSASSPVGNVGLLQVQATATTPITSITAQIMMGTNVVLDVTDFSYPAGQKTGTWTVKQPISPGQLALGSYTISVTATDSGHGTGSNPNAGTLNFVIEPTVTLAANKTSINYDNQSVTFTGKVTELSPGASAPQPMANQQVLLYSNAITSPSAVTGADGSFKIVVPNAIASWYNAVVIGTATMAVGWSNQVTVSDNPNPVHLVARLSPSVVNQGQSVTVSGTLTYKSGSTWKPVANAQISIWPVNYPPAVTVVTDVNGAFSAVLPDQAKSGTISVYFNYSNQFSLLLQQASRDLTLTVNQPTAIRLFSANLDSFARLSVKACLEITSPGGMNEQPNGVLDIMYSRNAAGPWRLLGKIWPSWNGTQYCPVAGANWEKTFIAPLANGYYRPVFTGSTGLLPSVGKVLHRWKYLTKITNFSVSPTSIARNGHVKVSGRLWKLGSRWLPYAGRRVMIIIKYRGVWYRYRGEPRTGSGGWFTGRFRAVVSGPLAAQYNGDATHFASISRLIRLTVSGSALNAVPRTAWQMQIVIADPMLLLW
jgi:hypothetical protein